MIPAIKRTNIQKQKDIQIGETTQNQPHEINPINLSVIKTIVRRPTKPIPVDEELDV